MPSAQPDHQVPPATTGRLFGRAVVVSGALLCALLGWAWAGAAAGAEAPAGTEATARPSLTGAPDAGASPPAPPQPSVIDELVAPLASPLVEASPAGTAGPLGTLEPSLEELTPAPAPDPVAGGLEDAGATLDSIATPLRPTVEPALGTVEGATATPPAGAPAQAARPQPVAGVDTPPPGPGFDPGLAPPDPAGPVAVVETAPAVVLHSPTPAMVAPKPSRITSIDGWMASTAPGGLSSGGGPFGGVPSLARFLAALGEAAPPPTVSLAFAAVMALLVMPRPTPGRRLALPWALGPPLSFVSPLERPG